MQVVTLSTAQKMKAAGFPQPEMVVGQKWYAEPEHKGGTLEHVPLCVVVEKYSTRTKFLRRLTCEKMTGEYGGKPEFFAPTATDILALLGGDYGLFKSTTGFEVWKANSIIHTAVSQKSFDNPAEACAEAYLSIFSIS